MSMKANEMQIIKAVALCHHGINNRDACKYSADQRHQEHKIFHE